MDSDKKRNERLLKILQAPPEIEAAIDRVLEGKPTASPAPDPETPLLYTVKQAASRLNASRSTVWRIIRAGRLKKITLYEGCERLRREDVEALVRGAK